LVPHALNEYTFGDELETRTWSDLGLEPHMITAALAHPLAELCGHPLRRHSGRDAPRLCHYNPPSGLGIACQQRRRHAGGLACTRFGHDYQVASLIEGARDLDEQVIDG
jgi:hypothetical protein